MEIPLQERLGISVDAREAPTTTRFPSIASKRPTRANGGLRFFRERSTCFVLFRRAEGGSQEAHKRLPARAIAAWGGWLIKGAESPEDSQRSQVGLERSLNTIHHHSLPFTFIFTSLVFQLHCSRSSIIPGLPHFT